MLNFKPGGRKHGNPKRRRKGRNVRRIGKNATAGHAITPGRRKLGWVVSALTGAPVPALRIGNGPAPPSEKAAARILERDGRRVSEKLPVLKKWNPKKRG